MTVAPHLLPNLQIAGSGSTESVTNSVQVWAAKQGHGTHLDNYWLCSELDQCGNGVKWDLRKTPNEIVQYKEFTVSASEIMDRLLLSSITGTSKVNPVYKANWLHFDGKWGQSVESEKIWYELYQASEFGSSPKTGIGIKTNCDDTNTNALNIVT